MTVFESVNLKKKIKHKLEHFQQRKSASDYTAEFRQIISVLDWDKETYISLFYRKLKNQIKNELAKIEWSDNLNEMMLITTWINNKLWERQLEK